MLVFPTYQRLVTSKGLPDTVTLSRSSYFATSNAANADFNQDITNVPTVPRSGKRIVLIHLTYRLIGSDAWSVYPTWFKPSGQGGSATFTIGGITPTFRDHGRTLYNGSAIYTMRADLNTSGSNATVSLDFDNTSFDTSGLTDFSATGGYGFNVWIFDYVQSYWYNILGNDGDGDPAYTGMSVNVAPPGTGSDFTASFKAVTGFSSNSNTLNWVKDSADTSTYTKTIDWDIGTNEHVETSHSFETTSSPSNLKGAISTSSGTAISGVAANYSFLRFIPSTS